MLDYNRLDLALKVLKDAGTTISRMQFATECPEESHSLSVATTYHDYNASGSGAATRVTATVAKGKLVLSWDGYSLTIPQK